MSNVVYANRWYQDEAEFSIFDYFQHVGKSEADHLAATDFIEGRL